MGTNSRIDIQVIAIWGAHYMAPGYDTSRNKGAALLKYLHDEYGDTNWEIRNPGGFYPVISNRHEGKYIGYNFEDIIETLSASQDFEDVELRVTALVEGTTMLTMRYINGVKVQETEQEVFPRYTEAEEVNPEWFKKHV